MVDYININKFNRGSVDKQIDMLYDENKHITNKNVVSGTFSLNESGCSTKELKFGSLVSSKLAVKLYNDVENLLNKQLTISITVDGDTDNPLNIGKYKVVSDKPTSDRAYKQIEAYDQLYEVVKANVAEWYNNLTFPIVFKDFRDSFCAYVGLEQVDILLVNDDMMIYRTIAGDTISGQQVLSAICELNGAIGIINRDGKLAYVTLEANPENRITIDNIAMSSGSYEDFETRPISKVQIKQMSGDVGAIVGTDGNTYIVQDNFLVYGKSSSELTKIATNLLSVIQGISYTPFSIEAVYGNPCYEIGDALEIVTKNKTFYSYMLNRTLNGIQAMSDKIKANGVEIYVDNVTGTNQTIRQLKRQTNVLTETVEGVTREIKSIQDDLDENYPTKTETNTMIQQATEGIAVEVEKIVSANLDVGGVNFMNNSRYLLGMNIGGLEYLTDELGEVLLDEEGNGILAP